MVIRMGVHPLPECRGAPWGYRVRVFRGTITDSKRGILAYEARRMILINVLE
jgi:hypothetical protein